jgi:hypothetical protein
MDAQEYRLKNFAVEVKPSRHAEHDWAISITHNGYQWQTIVLNPREMRLTIEKMQHVLAA